MKTTFAQKLGLSLIYTFIALFTFLEKFGVLITSTAFNTLRLLLLFFVFGTLLSFSTKLLVKPGQMFESFFYYQHYPSAGLAIRKELPKKIAENPLPYLTAESAIAVDVSTGKVLYEFNPDSPFPPASTTKVMTFLTAQSLYAPNEKIVISPECTTLDSQRAGFFPQELVEVQDLYYALLINSAGDAACALASKDQNFVNKMNENATVLGLKNTKFSNVVGFDNYDGQVSTARDLATLGIAAMKNDLVRKIVKTKNFNAVSSGTTHALTNTNRLLWEIPETVGLKTGTTDGAGEVLIYFYETEEKSIAVVVMRSSDRFGDTKRILDWILQSYSWQV